MARPKGSLNKTTLKAREILAKKKFCPISALITIYSYAVDDYLEYKDKRQNNRISPLEDQSPKFLLTAQHSARDIASYIHPKLKSIEYVETDPTQGLTDQEILDKYERAAKLYREKILAKNGKLPSRKSAKKSDSRD